MQCAFDLFVNFNIKRGKRMVAKKVTTRRKVIEPPASSTKNFPTAALGVGMVILTNYQAEVKQILGLIMKAFT